MGQAGSMKEAAGCQGTGTWRLDHRGWRRRGTGGGGVGSGRGSDCNHCDLK